MGGEGALLNTILLAQHALFIPALALVSPATYTNTRTLNPLRHVHTHHNTFPRLSCHIPQFAPKNSLHTHTHTTASQAALDELMLSYSSSHIKVAALHEAKKEALFTLTADLEEAQAGQHSLPWKLFHLCFFSLNTQWSCSAKMMNVEQQMRRIQQEKEMLMMLE